jgi:hypothetical protein
VKTGAFRAIAKAADRFKVSPGGYYLRLLDPEWILATDLAAWGLLEQVDAERAENEARALKGLPPLPKLCGPKKPASDTVQITVAGQKRTVPTPPANCFYDREGRLVRPDSGVRRF